jgi:hypothetical protein
MVENCNTFAEINKTVDENNVLTGSIIIVIIIGVLEILNSTHSINIVLFLNIKYVDRGAININNNHINMLACL